MREDVLPATKMTQEEFAKRLGVSRRTVNEILNEKRPISVDMALRLGTVLGNGAGFWLSMQQAVDVWDMLEENQVKYKKLKPLSKTA